VPLVQAVDLDRAVRQGLQSQAAVVLGVLAGGVITEVNHGCVIFAAGVPA
jgi:hypothetical protein